MCICPRALVALSDDAPLEESGKPLAFLNVGTGIDPSVRELAEKVSDAVGFKGSIHQITANRMGHQRNS